MASRTAQDLGCDSSYYPACTCRNCGRMYLSLREGTSDESALEVSSTKRDWGSPLLRGSGGDLL